MMGIEDWLAVSTILKSSPASESLRTASASTICSRKIARELSTPDRKSNPKNASHRMRRRLANGIEASRGKSSVIPNMSIKKMPSAASIKTRTRADTVDTGTLPTRAPAGTNSDMGSAISWKLMNAPPSATPRTNMETKKNFHAE